MRSKLLLVGILLSFALSITAAQTYYKCYNSCPAKNQTVGCEIYVNGNLAVQLGNQTNFYYYEYINDTTNNNLEELVCYYLSSNVTISTPAKAMKSLKTPRVIPPLPANPKPGNPPLKANPPINPPLFNFSNKTPLTKLGEVKLGQNIFSAKYFTCSKDCPEPQEGYEFIGCMIVVNHAFFNAVGRLPEVKPGVRNPGYTYIASHTDVKNGNIVYEEIISCEYWEKGKPLPPKFEPFDYREYYWESRGVDLSEYDKPVKALVQENIIHRYNEQITKLPKIAKGVLGDEHLHIYFTLGNETLEFAAITKDGIITKMGDWIDENQDGNYDLWEESGEKPTMNVHLNIDTLVKIAQSENPIEAFKEAWGEDIKYQGLTLGAKVKTFFMGIGVFFAGLLA